MTLQNNFGLFVAQGDVTALRKVVFVAEGDVTTTPRKVCSLNKEMSQHCGK